MFNKFLIDALHGINSVGNFNTIKENRCSFNIGDNNSKSIQDCSKEYDTLGIKLIQFNLSWHFNCKWRNSDGFDESLTPFNWYFFLIPCINFPLNDILVFLTGNNFHKLLGHFQHHLQEKSWNFQDQIVHLDCNHVEESVLHERSINLDVGVEDILRFLFIVLLSKLLVLTGCEDNWVGDVEGLRLIKLKEL